MGFLESIGKIIKDAVGGAVSDKVNGTINDLFGEDAANKAGDAFLADYRKTDTHAQINTPPENQRRPDIQAGGRKGNRWENRPPHSGYEQDELNAFSSMYKKDANSLTNGEVVTNFEHMLYTEFEDYEIRRNIPATEIGGEAWYVPYTFGMYKGGNPVVFIQLTPQGKHTVMPYQASARQCRNQGIKFVNFFTHFRNDRTYVIDRIKKYIY